MRIIDLGILVAIFFIWVLSLSINDYYCLMPHYVCIWFGIYARAVDKYCNDPHHYGFKINCWKNVIWVVYTNNRKKAKNKFREFQQVVLIKVNGLRFHELLI